MPGSAREPVQSDQLARGPRRPESQKGILAMAFAAAALACAGKASAQELSRDTIREQVVRTNLGATPDTPRLNAGEALRMSVRVTTLTERMQNLDAATIDTIARSIAAVRGGDQFSAFSVDLRRLNGARQIGNTYARGEASLVPLQTPEAVLRTRASTSPEVSSLQDADRAFTAALNAPPGLDRSRRAFILPEAMLNLLNERQVNVDQTREVLRSGLFAAPMETYRSVLVERPNAQVDLRSSFNENELRVFASYVDHLRETRYWSEEPEEGLQRNKDAGEPLSALTGEAILRGQIPLSYALRLYASGEAVGQFSRWDGMRWAMNSNTNAEELQTHSAQINVALCLKLARSMAEFVLRHPGFSGQAEAAYQASAARPVPVDEALPPARHHGHDADREHRPHHGVGHHEQHERHGQSAHGRRHHGGNG